MNKDQLIGALLLLGSIVGIIVYGFLMYSFSIIVLQITGFLIIAGGLAVVGWIGYTLATTPPPKPIEEIEKEIEKEMKAVKDEEAGSAIPESK
ncbi:MAG: transcriptional regulator [Nitrososphaeria archaeon]|jgi:predicted DNA-binding transcriptional regulator